MNQKTKKRIGCFPLYPPVEIFHSMGFQPVILWGRNSPFPETRESDRHIQAYSCSVSRSLAELVFQKGNEVFDALFMYNACDTLRNLPEVLNYHAKIFIKSIDLPLRI